MLADFKQEWREVLFKGGGFKVRGLSLEDLSLLIRTHLPDLKAMYARYSVANENGETTDDMVLSFVRDMPVLAAHLIAMAAGEESAVDQARGLPFPLQVDAVVNVLQLTFEDIGGPKNFGPLLRRLIGGVGLEVPNGLATRMEIVQTIQ
jgi:hypothetical protein